VHTVYEAVREGGLAVLDLIHEFETLPGHTKRHDELEEQINRLGRLEPRHRASARR
jgi:hypothetical protein